MRLWIYQGGRFPRSLELPLIYRTEDSSLYSFARPLIFGEILELYYLETLKKKKQAQNREQYRHSLRTIGDSLKDIHVTPTPYFTFLLSFNFSIS